MNGAKRLNGWNDWNTLAPGAKPVVQPRPMGCIVHCNQHGNLTFRINWHGMRFWEGLELADTPANRRIAEAQSVLIADEIERDTFDYLKWFPRGNKAHLFTADRDRAERKTLRSYYGDWIKGFKPPLAKKSRYRNYKGHFDNHILPRHGDLYVDQYSIAHIRDLLHFMVDVRKLSVKTAKNTINATLRAFLRDAAAEGLIEKSPFDSLPRKWWPKRVTDPPDPFEETERDAIVDHFRKKFSVKWRAGYVFMYALFWTGCRPSELTARRWRDIDFRTGKLQITNSRTEGEEGTTKTKGSNRTIKLFPPVLELVESIKPLRAQPNDHIFLNQRGRPIDQWNFGERHFQAALTTLKIRHRDFKNTRHTFISLMLVHGENPNEVADYCGNSPEVIWTNYAKWIRGKGTFGQAAIAAAGAPAAEKKARE